MPNDRVIPIIEEQAHVTKRSAETERVSVRTSPVVEDVLIREMLNHEHVEVTRVAVDREVDAAPAIRTEGDVTIVPVFEERLVVEKRLFVVEELHLRRTTRTEQVELPTTLRRMHVEVTREDLNPQEEH
ncbi:YsnF/AvaK domain-containing protein [Sphingomonas sp.]|uniref:YsnF/AvaK domain-containing protein n=1 Tax=Sphingomonas sp. TaxID=28214 RepID=UPI0035BC488D